MTQVIHLVSRRAAPPFPTTAEAEAVQLHAAAHNALSTALHYLRQPAANVQGAKRKAVQALAALNQLHGKG